MVSCGGVGWSCARFPMHCSFRGPRRHQGCISVYLLINDQGREQRQGGKKASPSVGGRRRLGGGSKDRIVQDRDAYRHSVGRGGIFATRNSRRLRARTLPEPDVELCLVFSTARRIHLTMSSFSRKHGRFQWYQCVGPVPSTVYTPLYGAEARDGAKRADEMEDRLTLRSDSDSPDGLGER